MLGGSGFLFCRFIWVIVTTLSASNAHIAV